MSYLSLKFIQNKIWRQTILWDNEKPIRHSRRKSPTGRSVFDHIICRRAKEICVMNEVIVHYGEMVLSIVERVRERLKIIFSDGMLSEKSPNKRWLWSQQDTRWVGVFMKMVLLRSRRCLTLNKMSYYITQCEFYINLYLILNKHYT